MFELLLEEINNNKLSVNLYYECCSFNFNFIFRFTR